MLLDTSVSLVIFCKHAGVEASETIGTTALVYYLINSSLYTGAVLYNDGSVHPNWFDGQ
jgi:hypothetical protein